MNCWALVTFAKTILVVNKQVNTFLGQSTEEVSLNSTYSTWTQPCVDI